MASEFSYSRVRTSRHAAAAQKLKILLSFASAASRQMKYANYLWAKFIERERERQRTSAAVECLDCTKQGKVKENNLI